MLRSICIGAAGWSVAASGNDASTNPRLFTLPAGARAGTVGFTALDVSHAPEGFHVTILADGVQVLDNACVTNATVTANIPAATLVVSVSFLPKCGVGSAASWTIAGANT